MISLSSLRVALFKINLRDDQQILARFFTNKILKKLDIRPKPKRPLIPFFRYMLEVRPSVTKSNPTSKAKELTVIMANMWKSLDDKEKQKYSEGYDEEKLKYMTEWIKYKESLSEDDETKIKQMVAKVRDKKMKLQQLAELRDLGRPKKPSNPYINYRVQHLAAAGTLTKKELFDHARQIGAQWKALTDDERAKYKSTEDVVKNYHKAMCEWETEMIRQGRRDLVRKHVIVPEEESTKQNNQQKTRKSSEGKNKTSN